MSTDEIAATHRQQLDALHNDGVLTDAEYEDALTRVDQHDATAAEAVAQVTDLPVPDAEQLLDGLAPLPPTAVAPVPPVPPADVPVGAPVPPADAPIAAASDAELALEHDAAAEPVVAAQTSVPCPTCGTAPTEVATATPVAVNPPVAVDGTEVEGGDTIHHCPHCGEILAVLEGDVEAAAADIQAAYEADLEAESTTSEEGGTDGSPDAPQQ